MSIRAYLAAVLYTTAYLLMGLCFSLGLYWTVAAVMGW